MMTRARLAAAITVGLLSSGACAQSSFRVLTQTQSSSGRAVSGDGRIIAGNSDGQACIWDFDLNRTPIQNSSSTGPYATDADADGDTFVTVAHALGSYTSAFRIILGSEPERIPNTWGTSNDYRISAAGDVVVGAFFATDVLSDSTRRISRWTAADGVQPLSGLEMQSGFSTDVSADGLTVVGEYNGTGSRQVAFKWTQAGGVRILPDLTAGFWRDSSVSAVNADGSVIVGASNDPSGVRTAVRWTSAGVQPLWYFSGDSGSYTTDVSEDGRVIGGLSLRPSQPSFNRAFIWTSCFGLETLQAYAARFGVSLAGYNFSVAHLRFNADGSVITGNCITPSGLLTGFVLVLRREMAPELTCPGGSASFTTPSNGMSGGTFQWMHNGAPITELPGRFTGTTSPTLVISNAQPGDVGSYNCIVTYPCGTIAGPAATLRICIGDFDCSGAVDGDDVIAFVGEWDAAIESADINHDGSVDGDDMIDWFGGWDAGC